MNIVLTGFCGYVALAVIVFCIVYTMVKAGMDLHDAWVLRKWRKSKIDKACEWMRAHLGAPAGLPQAKSYNDAINELTTEFCKGMEE